MGGPDARKVFRKGKNLTSHKEYHEIEELRKNYYGDVEQIDLTNNNDGRESVDHAEEAEAVGGDEARVGPAPGGEGGGPGAGG